MAGFKPLLWAMAALVASLAFLVLSHAFATACDALTVVAALIDGVY